MSSAPISQDQWDHMLETWRIFDADGDGLITSHDLKTVLLSFGYEHSIEVSSGCCRVEVTAGMVFGCVAFHQLVSDQKMPQDLDEYLDKLPLCVERDGCVPVPSPTTNNTVEVCVW